MKVVSATDVFELGKYGKSRALTPKVKVEFTKAKRKYAMDLETLVLSPTTPGTYSVVLFFHGFTLHNDSYSELLQHISSHGYIVVAPQVYEGIFFSAGTELEVAAGVTNWISTSLQSIHGLPPGVTANVQRLALAGHSRGGKTAFALALGKAETKSTLKPSVLIGLDPVAGTEPHILTHVPRSFELDIPVTVIGTGLENPLFSLITGGKNHDEFFKESRPPCAHIVAKEFGHMDMLNDGCDWMQRLGCDSGTGDKNQLRKCLGGIFVAALRDSLEGKSDDFKAIVNKTVVPPVTLDPITYIEDGPHVKARL